ncbi:hypothetical protein SAMN06265355_13036 [Actinomadura mexicana]|uniref:Uncharacterized protein n=1 Tax=Actinomadura mexicana TaxID=134959 RepID=A0A239HFD5_9ACTN|nr:hypothetical protein SAMN06265355_13036 [Actinomadura mexicana]
MKATAKLWGNGAAWSGMAVVGQHTPGSVAGAPQHLDGPGPRGSRPSWVDASDRLVPPARADAGLGDGAELCGTVFPRRGRRASSPLPPRRRWWGVVMPVTNVGPMRFSVCLSCRCCSFLGVGYAGGFPQGSAVTGVLVAGGWWYRFTGPHKPGAPPTEGAPGNTGVSPEAIRPLQGQCRASRSRRRLPPRTRRPAAEKIRSRRRLGSQRRAGWSAKASIWAQAVRSAASVTSSSQTWLAAALCRGRLRRPMSLAQRMRS